MVSQSYRREMDMRAVLTISVLAFPGSMATTEEQILKMQQDVSERHP
jgi:hypothetical protein